MYYYSWTNLSEHFWAFRHMVFQHMEETDRVNKRIKINNSIGSSWNAIAHNRARRMDPFFLHWQCWRQWIHWQVPLRLFPGPPWHLFVITQEAPLRPLPPPPYCSPRQQLLLRLLLLLLLLGLFFAKVHDNKNSNVRNGIRLVHDGVCVECWIIPPPPPFE